jgi:hypothetical protein
MEDGENVGNDSDKDQSGHETLRHKPKCQLYSRVSSPNTLRRATLTKTDFPGPLYNLVQNASNTKTVVKRVAKAHPMSKITGILAAILPSLPTNVASPLTE